ncbi:ABC transporter permease [Paenibacillus hamazuiensis]|uniref:ABC transporter permease n=1 Tax=Paenibacillus hamazuiensis TaxID=2936508 RepID=UPI00200F9D7C|nr:iron ABC transporter permease [Paenibacillus hamazuiensis]
MNTNPQTIQSKRDGVEAGAGLFFFLFAAAKKCALLLPVAVLALFFALPVVKLIVLSMQHDSGFTFAHYADLLQEPRTWKTLKDTAAIVIGSSLLAVILGAVTAWFVAYTDLKYKQALQMAILFSYMIPSYVLTISWTSLMGTQGPAAYLLHLVDPNAKPWSMYSYGGIIFMMGIHHFPLVYLLSVDVFRKVPRDLEWASRAGGAGKVKTFFLVTLPIALPGLAGGGLLAFLAGLDNFGIPAFLGIPAHISVLSTLIYEQIIGFGPSAFSKGAALSVVLVLFAAAGAMLQWLLVRKNNPFDAGVPDDSPRYFLGPYRTLVSLLLWGFLAVITVVPSLSMLAVSLKKAYGVPFTLPNLTLDHYQYILFESTKVWRSMQNSFLLAAVTLGICFAFGTWIAYVRVRRPSWLAKTAEIVIALPFTLPGIVFGLAMIFVWMEPVPGWNPGIYGSMQILFIAYVCRFLILQVRSGISAFMQIDVSMEEAAHIFGADRRRKWLRILLPLLAPGLLGGGILVFLTALTELTVSAILWSAGSQTIGVTVYGFEQAGDTMYSTALSSLVIALILAGMAVIYTLQKVQAKRGVRS